MYLFGTLETFWYLAFAIQSYIGYLLLLVKRVATLDMNYVGVYVVELQVAWK